MNGRGHAPLQAIPAPDWAYGPPSERPAFALNDFAALDLWRRTLARAIRGDAPDLTQRQLAILLAVYLTQPPHTVRGLAAQLQISKPAVTRALDRLAAFDFAKRKPDSEDRRSVLVQRTVKGVVYLRAFGAQIAACADEVARAPLGVSALASIAGSANDERPSGRKSPRPQATE